MKRSVLKKYGKKNAIWRKVRAAWMVANPPSHEGYYTCGICGQAVHVSDMELDHIASRSRSPESFTDFSNLQPSHHQCNTEKGSRMFKPEIDQEEYMLRKKLDL